MIIHLPRFTLRPPEPKDCQALYIFKNDPDLASLLGGFHAGYSMADLADWIEFHRKRKDEIIRVIADPESDDCIGHVGLYNIDYRVRSAEFAIMIGAANLWGKGLGRLITDFVVKWGFRELNLNRVHLSVLQTNERAIKLYRSLGFSEEGRQRDAQFKNNQYIDVILMAILRSECKSEE